MKKSVLSILGVAIIIAIVFVSCMKNEEESAKQVDYSALKVAGNEHNKGLDYVYKELKTLKEKDEQNFKSTIDIYETVKNSTKDFLKNNSEIVSTSNVDFALNCANDAFNWIESIYNNSKDLSNSSEWYENVENSLSPKQKELLSLINEAIDNQNLDLDATLLIMENVRNRANIELNENERYVIISAIEIGTNSMVYWSENIDEWANLFDNNKSIKAGWFNWKAVGGADIKGGVAGAVSGGITGGVAGAGTGALAGGLGASAGSVASQLWDHWTN